jgi:hypothetical protein
MPGKTLSSGSLFFLFQLASLDIMTNSLKRRKALWHKASPAVKVQLLFFIWV